MSATSPTADEIRTARFRPVRLRAGYDMDTVDELLDQLADACDQGADPAPIAAGARFPVVKLREGYSIDEVDAFLERFGPGGRSSAAQPVAAATTVTSRSQVGLEYPSTASPGLKTAPFPASTLRL